MIRNSSVTRGGVQQPCGKCAACLARRVSNWSFRLMQEERKSLSAYFVTLTYDCNSVPITKNGFMGLSCDDLQKFFKRLRWLHDSYGEFGVPLKYYAVGEYGGRFKRPHYHIILFNAELRLIVGEKYASLVDRGIVQLDGKVPFKLDQWPKGHITIGQVTEASVGYTMKYVSKPSVVPMHRNDDRQPEFSRMSKGLGIGYLTKAMIAWHKADLLNRQYCQLKDGKKISMPRYYKTKILDLQEKECLRALNVLQGMKEREKSLLSSRDKSEAYYAGKNRMSLNVKQNQKL